MKPVIPDDDWSIFGVRVIARTWRASCGKGVGGMMLLW